MDDCFHYWQGIAHVLPPIFDTVRRTAFTDALAPDDTLRDSGAQNRNMACDGAEILTDGGNRIARFGGVVLTIDEDAQYRRLFAADTHRLQSPDHIGVNLDDSR